MNKFETYLINKGLLFAAARRYAKVATYYVNWLKENNLQVENVKRSQFTDWLQTYREQGLKQKTLDCKENIIRYYYWYLGTKNNPAISWIIRKDEYVLPPPPLEKNELLKMYESLKPKKNIEYRNRCILGFIVFQGLKRNELEEMRISDINFQTGSIFIQAQRKSNSRRLKLEAIQMLHLHDYFKKYRKKLLVKKKTDTDKFFVSACGGARLENVLHQLIKEVKEVNPQVINLFHIRTSVITHWRNEYGLMEAMVKAGHLHLKTTKRYETNKYEQLQEQLRNIHPLELMQF